MPLHSTPRYAPTPHTYSGHTGTDLLNALNYFYFNFTINEPRETSNTLHILNSWNNGALYFQKLYDNFQFLCI